MDAFRISIPYALGVFIAPSPEGTVLVRILFEYGDGIITSPPFLTLKELNCMMYVFIRTKPHDESYLMMSAALSDNFPLRGHWMTDVYPPGV